MNTAIAVIGSRGNIEPMVALADRHDGRDRRWSPRKGMVSALPTRALDAGATGVARKNAFTVDGFAQTAARGGLSLASGWTQPLTTMRRLTVICSSTCAVGSTSSGKSWLKAS